MCLITFLKKIQISYWTIIGLLCESKWFGVIFGLRGDLDLDDKLFDGNLLTNISGELLECFFVVEIIWLYFKIGFFFHCHLIRVCFLLLLVIVFFTVAFGSTFFDFFKRYSTSFFWFLSFICSMTTFDYWGKVSFQYSAGKTLCHKLNNSHCLMTGISGIRMMPRCVSGCNVNLKIIDVFLIDELCLLYANISSLHIMSRNWMHLYVVPFNDHCCQIWRFDAENMILFTLSRCNSLIECIFKIIYIFFLILHVHMVKSYPLICCHPNCHIVDQMCRSFGNNISFSIYWTTCYICFWCDLWHKIWN